MAEEAKNENFIYSKARRIQGTHAESLFKVQRAHQLVYGIVSKVFEKVPVEWEGQNIEEQLLEVLVEGKIPVYVRQSEAGAFQSGYLGFSQGDRVLLTILDMIEVGKHDENGPVAHDTTASYVGVGSISEAHLLRGQELSEQFEREIKRLEEENLDLEQTDVESDIIRRDFPLHLEQRGVVTATVPNYKRRNSRTGELESYPLVIVDFNGLPVQIPYREFTYQYRSVNQEINDVVEIGEVVYFKFTRFSKARVNSAMEAKGMTGEYYVARGTRLYLEQPPHEALKEMLGAGVTSALATITNSYERGFFCELVDAPGISLKLVIAQNQAHLAEEAIEKHERIAVSINRNDFSRQGRRWRGTVRFIPKKVINWANF